MKKKFKTKKDHNFSSSYGIHYVFQKIYKAKTKICLLTDQSM